jgi:hypothetical protein
VFKRGRDENEPWGRVNLRYVIDETGFEKHSVEYVLRRSTTRAGSERRLEDATSSARILENHSSSTIPHRLTHPTTNPPRAGLKGVGGVGDAR